MTEQSMVVLGLGTNLGDRAQHLRRAVKAIAEVVSDLACSPVYESHALLPVGAPDSWDMAFLNVAVCGMTELAPREMLAKAKAIEQALGRAPRGRWGPREIDIDILAYGEFVVADPELIIPHRELLLRDFALIPLADVTPDWVHPLAKGKRRTARQLAAKMKSKLKKTEIVL